MTSFWRRGAALSLPPGDPPLESLGLAWRCLSLPRPFVTLCSTRESTPLYLPAHQPNAWTTATAALPLTVQRLPTVEGRCTRAGQVPRRLRSSSSHSSKDPSTMHPSMPTPTTLCSKSKMPNRTSIGHSLSLPRPRQQIETISPRRRLFQVGLPHWNLFPCLNRTTILSPALRRRPHGRFAGHRRTPSAVGKAQSRVEGTRWETL